MNLKEYIKTIKETNTKLTKSFIYSLLKENRQKLLYNEINTNVYKDNKKLITELFDSCYKEWNHLWNNTTKFNNLTHTNVKYKDRANFNNRNINNIPLAH